ncbi:ester cyclase [Sinosporangium siamense]|nr:ester cyclase [Sinosporangium siamense]
MDRMIGGFRAKDMDKVMSALSPAVVVTSPEGVAQGHEEFSSYVALFWEAFPDALAAEEASAEATRGDTAVCEVSVTATHTGPYLVAGAVIPPTGRALRLRICYVGTVEDGVIVSLREYYDQMDLLTQLGHRPEMV